MKIDVKTLFEDRLDKQYDDKVFWYASKVIIEGDTISVYTKNENIVSFDTCDYDSLKVSQINSIKQESKTHMNDVLISGGSFLFINEKLLVTQRQLTTEFDAGFWTNPTGRCDKSIYETAIKETVEEIDIYRDEKRYLPDISKKFVKDFDDIVFYKTQNSNEEFNLKTSLVKFYFEDELIEEFYAWYCYVDKVNTIEFRLPIFTILDEQNLTFVNNEFDMPTALKSIEELKSFDLVPSLKRLVEELSN